VGVLTTVPELNTGNPYGPVCQYDTTRRTKKRRTETKKGPPKLPSFHFWKTTGLEKLVSTPCLPVSFTTRVCGEMCCAVPAAPSVHPIAHTSLSPPESWRRRPWFALPPATPPTLIGSSFPDLCAAPTRIPRSNFRQSRRASGKAKKTNTAALVQTSLRRFLGASLRLCASSQTNIPTCLQLWISLSRILSTRVRGQEASFGG